MGEFGWAYIDGGAITSSQGPDNSVQIRIGPGSTTVSGSKYFTWNTASNELFVTGAVYISGGISASSFTVKDIIHINTSGSTIFGNDNSDTHVFTGSLTIQSASSGADSGATSIFSSSLDTTPFIYATRLGVGIGRTTTPSVILQVGGSISGSGDLNVAGSASVEGSLGVSGSTTLGNKAGDVVTVTGKVSGSGDLNIAARTFLNGETNISGTITAAGALTVTGVVTAANRISGSGDITSAGQIIAEGNLKTSGSLTVVGTSAYTGNISGSADLNIAARTFLNGETNISGALTAAGALTVTGVVTAANRISGSGDITSAGQIIAEGNLKTSGSLTSVGTISGSGDLNVAGRAFFNGETNISGTITIGGATSFNANVTLGNAASDVTTATGQLTASQGILISGGRSLVADDIKLYFGTGQESSIEYDENGDDFLIISGSASGIGLSGSVLNVVSDTAYFRSATSNKPVVYIRNDNADANPGILNFDKTTTGVADNDILGQILFTGLDAGGALTQYARIGGEIKKKTAGAERGRIKFEVAEYDGTLTEGFTIQGSNADGQVDITIPAGNLTLVDDRKIYFGTGLDASIEYDEDGTDELRFAGAAVTFEQAVTFDANMTLGLAAGNVITSAGQLTASQGISLALNSSLADDKKFFFGTNLDAYLSYDEANDNRLIISGSKGSAGGTGISGSALYLAPGTVASGSRAGPNSYLAVTTNNKVVLVEGGGGGGTPGGSDTQVQYNNGGAFGGVATLTYNDSDGHLTIIDDKKLQFGTGNDASFEYDEDGTDTLLYAGASMRISDDVKVEFGTGGDASIEYDENGDNRLIISGSHTGGTTISGSNLLIETTSGMTVKSAADDYPELIIQNESDGMAGGVLIFKRTTTDEAANDIIGMVQFQAMDAAGNNTFYATIAGEIDDPTSGGEEGRLIFKVAAFNGSLTEGFRIEGQAAAGVVNCRVHAGSLQLKDLGGDGTTPASGFGGIYVNGDNLYFIDDGGTKAQLNVAGATLTANQTFSGVNTFSNKASITQLTASTGIDFEGGVRYHHSAKTMDFTAGDRDYMFFVDVTGSIITGTLPPAATVGAGKTYVFKDVSGSAATNNLVISGSTVSNVLQSIDGASQVKITSNSGSVTVTTDGTNWFIIGTS